MPDFFTDAFFLEINSLFYTTCITKMFLSHDQGHTEVSQESKYDSASWKT